MREKDQMLHFRVSKAELDIIRQKMQEVGVRNMGAYLRKMAMDGYCIRLDLSDLKKVVSLMRYASNNLNQYARKASGWRNSIRFWTWTEKRTILTVTTKIGMTQTGLLFWTIFTAVWRKCRPIGGQNPVDWRNGHERKGSDASLPGQ